jgi:hypothetical protein
MAVQVLCHCGTDITDDISLWDKKTRSAFWFEEHAPLCRACAARKTMQLAMSQPTEEPTATGTTGRRTRRV